MPAVHNQVHVLGHEAVHEYPERVFMRSAPKLRQHQIHHPGVPKEWMPVERDEGQELADAADVGERRA